MLMTLAPLILGLAAWTLNVLCVCSRRKGFCTLSCCLCACALWFPLYTWNRRAGAEDVAAMLDCAHAYALCAGVLILVNLLLTGIGLLRK